MQNNFDKAPCIYFSTKDDGTLLEVNDQLCSALEYSKKELEGKKTELFFTVPTRIFQQTHFFPLLKMHGHAEEIFLTLKKRNGEELPVLINAERKTIEGVAVNLYIGIIVHNRKKFEEELIAARRAAENALNENTTLLQIKEELQKHSEQLDQQIQLVSKQNEELRQFNRVVTHDMQEPLRKLSVFSTLLLDDNEKHHQKDLVEKIRRVANQMKGILHGLQQYVWLTETMLRMVPIDLKKLLPLIQQQLQEEFPDIVLKINTEIAESFNADWEQMRVLFSELLSNAIRFRKNNEVMVTVSTQELQLNQFRNLEGKYKFVDYVRIQVRDYGIGFNPAYKNQVFELFKKLHTESGRGVGLSLCKRITENHRGMISIDSKIDEGTVTTILLPKVISISSPADNIKLVEAKNTNE
jgi:sigma-B regulation protein RsbU (phosphoserine phosphatase)